MKASYIKSGRSPHKSRRGNPPVVAPVGMGAGTGGLPLQIVRLFKRI
ncbi:MAG: hypothetical protein F6J93_19425 [Oscillatoria sp. SIO1A7]|nr:hypothetical protein [Oscillatoria sp. SIO1A7]